MLINTILDQLSSQIQQGNLSNGDMVQIIELLGGYLNLATISDYGAANGMSYNGVIKPVKNGRQVVELFNVKFVIDNQ